MPKLKTNRGASKRFKKTKNGKIKRQMAYGRHLMAGKSPKRRRRLRKGGLLGAEDTAAIRKLLPYG